MTDRQRRELTRIMEVMRMHEKYYTPEQLTQLEARREEVGSDQIAAIERECVQLSAQMKAHRDAGFTDGDPGITDSLSRMYREEGPENASRGTFDADLLECVTPGSEDMNGPAPHRPSSARTSSA